MKFSLDGVNYSYESAPNLPFSKQLERAIQSLKTKKGDTIYMQSDNGNIIKHVYLG